MTGSEETSSDTPTDGRDGRSLWRWFPLVAVLGLMSVAFAMGWHHVLSLKTVGLHYHDLVAWIRLRPMLALLAFVLGYAGAVALSLPVALVMTLTGGLLFGWKLGAAASVVGATTGATILFLIVRTSFGAVLAAKAGPFVARLSIGFRDNALSYLLFLRLVPAFPFFVVNLVPALLGVPLVTFVVGTALGIVPGTVAYSLASSGLGAALEAQNAVYRACLAAHPAHGDEACPYSIDLKALVTPELVYGLIAIGLVALLPALVRQAVRLRSKLDVAA